MNLTSILQRMQILPGTLAALVTGISDEDLRWRPSESDWSILEVLCHLADEEVEDFRTRLQLLLRQDGSAWPPINPPQAAVDRGYQGQAVAAVLSKLATERHASLDWLRTLTDVDWSAEYHHPQIGILRTGDLLASWAAHDALHLRQIAKRLFQMAQRDALGFSTLYAGEWRA